MLREVLLMLSGDEFCEKLSSLECVLVEVKVMAESWEDLVWDLALSKLLCFRCCSIKQLGKEF